MKEGGGGKTRGRDQSRGSALVFSRGQWVRDQGRRAGAERAPERLTGRGAEERLRG